MLMYREREQIVSYCRRMTQAGLTRGTGGNISIYDREQKRFAISPSGIAYNEMRPEDVVVMSREGEIVEGDCKPSTELELHRIFYEKRQDLNAVVHTHGTYCTVLGVLREKLPASSYLVAYAGSDVRCAKYAAFGTRELAENVYEAMRDRYAALMANHGLLAGGKDLEDAFTVAEEIEFCAETYVKARMIGTPVLLERQEMADMLCRIRADYGQNRK
jgi:L-fuculose-phosphate aldolase